MQFFEGQHVIKREGYPFPGVVEVGFRTWGDKVRYVVNFVDRDGLGTPTGLLHIFEPSQLAADERFDRDGKLIAQP